MCLINKAEIGFAGNLKFEGVGGRRRGKGDTEMVHRNRIPVLAKQTPAGEMRLTKRLWLPEQSGIQECSS